MDIHCKKLLMILAMVMITSVIVAQEKVSKRVAQNYQLTNAGQLQIDTKYGDVKIIGWAKNNVSIIADITVTHKKLDNAQSLLGRIKPEFKSMTDFVGIRTQIEDKNEGFFAKYFNKANPFDFDRSNVQINYTIYLPVNAELDITNKFGDVIVDDWSGKLKIGAQHGDIWINKNLNSADIDLRYGKLKAKNINYGSIRLKNGSLDLIKLKDLRLTSSGSDIIIEEIASLELYSSKDEIVIDGVEDLSGSLEFTKMQLDKVEDGIDIEMKITDFKLSNIHSADAKINIHQESSEIVLNIQDFSFDFEATLEEGLLRLPKSFSNVETNMLDEGKRIREVKATYGKDRQGSITITGEKGVILLKEL